MFTFRAAPTQAIGTETVVSQLAVPFAADIANCLSGTGRSAAHVFGFCLGYNLPANGTGDSRCAIAVICIRRMSERLALGFVAQTTGFRQRAGRLTPLMDTDLVTPRKSKYIYKEQEC